MTIPAFAERGVHPVTRARHEAEVPPPFHWREFPPRYTPGRIIAGEAAALRKLHQRPTDQRDLVYFGGALIPRARASLFPAWRIAICIRHYATMSPDPARATKITLPRGGLARGNEHIWNQYTLRVHGPGRRDALLAHLQERKIGAEVYYPIPLDRQQCFQNIGRGGETCVRCPPPCRRGLEHPDFPRNHRRRARGSRRRHRGVCPQQG